MSIPVPRQDMNYVNLKTKEEYTTENGRIQITLQAAGSAVLVSK